MSARCSTCGVEKAPLAVIQKRAALIDHGKVRAYCPECLDPLPIVVGDCVTCAATVPWKEWPLVPATLASHEGHEIEMRPHGHFCLYCGRAHDCAGDCARPACGECAAKSSISNAPQPSQRRGSRHARQEVRSDVRHEG